MNGYQLPSDPFTGAGALPRGFGTPASDRAPQVLRVPPRRVIPIVFLPGIMGSNLSIADQDRIRRLGRDPKDAPANIAWRPDTLDASNVWGPMFLSPARRQLLLDPDTTAVDVYAPASRRSDVDGDGRHRNVVLSAAEPSPLLTDDSVAGGTTAAQKARMRGWGEVYFKSYGPLLQRLENRLQNVFSGGSLTPGWRAVVDVDPRHWHLDPSTPQKTLTADELKAITKDTVFPVHAIGYNWLVSNRRNANDVAKRIREIVGVYEKVAKRDCPGVIVVTHSMGGLLGRALVHPDMGGLQDLVLGVVHGVQPATGAAAAYARMRAGFEDAGMLRDKDASGAAKVAGNFGDEVTAVLAYSPGALQLLPTKAYGNGWLRVEAGGRELLRLPAAGDPYEEIYKLKDKWYGLLPHEDWVNPAKLAARDGASTMAQAHKCINVARDFHDALGDAYHEHTYAHYGADRQRLAFGNVTWRIDSPWPVVTGWKDWPIVHDTRQGTVYFPDEDARRSAEPLAAVDVPVTSTSARLAPPDEPGDQTVPMRSADRPLRLGKCKAAFRQTGYEHQGSYLNDAVLDSTLFSIMRIAQRVQAP